MVLDGFGTDMVIQGGVIVEDNRGDDSAVEHVEIVALSCGCFTTMIVDTVSGRLASMGWCHAGQLGLGAQVEGLEFTWQPLAVLDVRPEVAPHAQSESGR